MKLLREAYYGLCGFAGGELDLRHVPPGLITLTGPNWNGKTTLLELPLAGWYREWASRTTNSLAKWADSRDSWVEIDYEIGGTVYRSRVNVDALSGKIQAVLSKLTPNGWQLLTDGKVSTYDDAMGQLIPPKDALLCSQFAAQNRAGSLTLASRAKRKDLFIHFLWLDHIIAMSETAKMCAGIAETTAMVLRSKIDGLERECGPELEATFTQESEALTAQLQLLEAQAQELSEQIAVDDAERQELADAVAEHVAAVAERVRLMGVREAALRELAELPKARERVERDASWDLTNSQQRLQRGLAAIDQKVAELQAVLAEAAFVRESVTESDALKDEQDRIRTRLTVIPTEIAAASDARRDVVAAGTIASVPCGGTETYAKCKFLTDAVAARARLGSRTEAEVEVGLQTLNDEVSSLQTRLGAVQKAILGLKPVVAKKAALDHAQDRLAEYGTQREELVATEAERVAEVNRRRVDALAACDEKEARLQQEIEATAQAIEALAPVIARTEGAKTRVGVLEAVLADAREELSVCERQRAREQERLAYLDKVLAEIQAKRARIAAIAPRLAAVDDALRVQQLIAKAFHRNGLPTLEIAAAAPAISTLTTDLLEHSGFGSRFRVDVTTLVPTADGDDWKEDFAVRVWDNDRGKEILDIGDLSGGERILVEEALRAALTIYMASRHTHRVRTCWRDETTGPLDNENRPRYISMLRRLRELGQYDHVIYVSHADDAIESADTIVDVRNGQPTIRRVA